MYEWAAAIVLGLFAGLAVGYTLKVAFKLFLFILGFLLIGVGILWYYGFVTFNLDAAYVIWEKIKTMALGGLSGQTYELTLELIPPVAAFFIGIVLAWKKL